MLAPQRVRFTLALAAVAVAGLGLSACSANRNAQFKGNNGTVAPGAQPPPPFAIQSNAPAQPTVTQPPRTVTGPVLVGTQTPPTATTG